MPFFRDLSIRFKLMGIIVLTSTLVLVLACTAYIAYDWIEFKGIMVRDHQTLAEIIAGSSTAALEFEDPRAAQAYLASLRAKSHVISACLYRADGQVFARYHREGADFQPPRPEGDLHRFEEEYLVLFRPIVVEEEEEIGTVYLQVDLQGMQERLERHLYIFGLFTLVSMLLAVGLAGLLQRLISEPIARLARTADAISMEKDYSVRVEEHGRDELGTLIKGFNEMLTQIQIRDRGLEQKVLERTVELGRSETKLSKITSSAQDAIVMIDTEGKVSFWNEAAERIFGYAQEEILDQPLHDTLVPEDYRESFRKGFAQFQKSGEGAAIGQALELTGLRKNEEVFPVELSLSGVELEDGWHAVGLLRDITQRKQAEEELIEAKQEAEEANQAKSLFLANMSHEIRTPMNAVIGFSDLLEGTALDAPQREYVQTVQTSAQALLELINDILDFSKIEAGKLEMEQRGFRLRDVLEETADLFREKVAGTGVELIVDIAAGTPGALQGDPLRLRQVLVNLTGNALKFTETGEVEIRVAPVDVEPAQTTLRFAVRDTGVGIPADKIGRLFTAFTQADGSTTRKYGGTGLGLAVSRQLVELMGGEIGVESREGEGSTFHFTAVFGRGSATEAEAVVPAAGSVDSRSLAGARILLVEDNPVNQRLATIVLQQAGCAVEVAGNGREAVAAVGARGYDAVLMDVQMPEMDGYEAARQIRQGGGALPIIAMTASAMKGDRELCLEAGMDDYVSKPIDREELFGTLRKWIGELRTGEDRGTEASAAESANILPTSLPGIDLPEVMGRMGNDEELLRDLLAKFAGEFGDAVDEIRQALDVGDEEGVRRLVHTLKGTAGNLSAKGVQAVARELEEAIDAERSEPFEGLLAQMERALAQVFDGVGERAPLEASGEGREPGSAAADGRPLRVPDRETLAGLLESLRQGLRDQDPVAADSCLEEVGAQLAGTALEERFRLLAGQIGDFDFGAARDTLETLVSELEMPLD